MNMDIDERIYQALLNMHADDLTVIRQYVRWVKFRRRIHNQFYFMAHWIRKHQTLTAGQGMIKRQGPAHWIGT